MQKAVASGSISIHAAREGGDQSRFAVRQAWQISIHAAREGGDAPDILHHTRPQISIHAAREGGDFAVCSVV